MVEASNHKLTDNGKPLASSLLAGNAQLAEARGIVIGHAVVGFHEHQHPPISLSSGADKAQL